MDFAFSDEQKLLRETVRKLMDTHAPPEYIRRLDREQGYPYELYEKWVEAGLLCMPFPEEYGGLGGSVIDLTIIAEELARKSPDFFMSYAGSVFTGLNIMRKGTEAQKQAWLPKLFAGEVRMAIAISEPEAGSDIGAMRTFAVRDGDDYIVNGQKLWATVPPAWNCANSTCSAAAAPEPTKFSSRTYACRPTGSSAVRTKAGTAF